MQRQGRINKLKQQQPCLHRNAELSPLPPASLFMVCLIRRCARRILELSSSGGTSRPRSRHILACLACLGLIVAARAKQQQPAFGLPVRPVHPLLRCRDVRWCVQLGLCCWSCSRLLRWQDGAAPVVAFPLHSLLVVGSHWP
jgi:hypothetical protein